jgi:hypothetical protein
VKENHTAVKIQVEVVLCRRVVLQPEDGGSKDLRNGRILDMKNAHDSSKCVRMETEEGSIIVRVPQIRFMMRNKTHIIKCSSYYFPSGAALAQWYNAVLRVG